MEINNNILKTKLEKALEEFKEIVSALTISDCVFTTKKSIKEFRLTDKSFDKYSIVIAKKKKKLEGGRSYLVKFPVNFQFDGEHHDYYNGSTTKGHYCEGFQLKEKWISDEEYTQLTKAFDDVNSVEFEVTEIKLAFTNGKDEMLNKALGKIERIIGNVFNGFANDVLPTRFYSTSIPNFAEDEVKFSFRTYNICDIFDNTLELNDETKIMLFNGIKEFLLSTTVV